MQVPDWVEASPVTYWLVNAVTSRYLPYYSAAIYLNFLSSVSVASVTRKSGHGMVRGKKREVESIGDKAHDSWLLVNQS